MTTTIQSPRATRATMRGLVCPDHRTLLQTGHRFHHCSEAGGHRVYPGTLEPERRQP
jgi:hypothetical protein